MQLSKKRANSLKQYLVKKFGIKASRIATIGYGFDKPVASNDTEEGRQKNRRAEVFIETMKTK
jgi:OOP family OmpA-OmpF porin